MNGAKQPPSGVRHARAAPARVAGRALLVATALVACSATPPRPPAAPRPDRIDVFEGNVHLGDGEELAYRAILAPNPAAPGEHVGTVDIPMQALSGASLERVRFEPGRRIEFSLALPGTPRWVGVVADDGHIACEFRQGDVRLPCSMSDAASSGVR
ncbi:MAG TPA: hypothetical protein VMG12_05240 [Polyangiaceae bacterium]|nr:hypothetical protein [Polyangiaceae bacterium]